jgi:cell pole-organizing protein PopZ
MTNINGANSHSVEDLLSSIRNSIGDDVGGLRQGPSSPFNQSATRRDARLPDDSAEFELPAIFKPGHQNQHSEKPGNLFGRLSDALKPGTPVEPDRSRTVIRFEPASAGRMIEPPATMMVQPQRPVAPSEPSVKSATEDTTVKREMPSFFDTRLNRLGELTRQASAPKPVEPPAPPVQAVAPQPPPLKPQAPVAEAVPNSGLEDAAAQLLRPILKQWLTENMPKIVEKALRGEVGDDFPAVGTPPNRRK